MAGIAGLQGDLAQQVGTMNERLARMIEGSVRGRTNDAERNAAREARVAELEMQGRALVAGQGR